MLAMFIVATEDTSQSKANESGSGGQRMGGVRGDERDASVTRRGKTRDVLGECCGC